MGDAGGEAGGGAKKTGSSVPDEYCLASIVRLGGLDVEVLTESAWAGRPDSIEAGAKWLMVWRVLAWLWVAPSIIIDWFSFSRIPWIFLTHWGSTSVIVYLSFAVFASVNRVYHLIPLHPDAPPPAGCHAGCVQRCCGWTAVHQSWVWANRATYFCFEFAFAFEVALTILYWLVLYDGSASWTSWNAHLIMCIVMVVELVLTRMHFVARHFVLVFGLAVIYLFVNLIETVSNRAVYGVLTWDKASNAILVIGSFILMAIGFFGGMGLAALRDKLLPRPHRGSDGAAGPVSDLELTEV